MVTHTHTHTHTHTKMEDVPRMKKELIPKSEVQRSVESLGEGQVI